MPEAHSEPNQTSKKKVYVKTAISFKPLTVFASSSIPDSQNQLVCSSQGKNNRSNLVISRKEMAYQWHIGKASLPDKSQEPKLYFNSHAN